MSKQSEKVKRWRKRCKNRIIEAMGGSCCICGYNKCQTALALHHLDPSKKDFGLSKIRANIQSWNKIVEELRKCVLVCHNCHSEIHEGLAKVPENAPNFDEAFVDYKALESENDNSEIWTTCPICQEMKPTHLITCSRECAAKMKYKVDWDKIDLERELKSKSIVQLAEELNCSDSAVHKRLRSLGLK